MQSETGRSTPFGRVCGHPFEFMSRVWRVFRSNGGMLLASAVAYHTLLSLIPMLALIVIGLSRWFDPQTVEAAVRQFLHLVAPTQVEPVLQQLAGFRSRTGVTGLAGFASLLFFSAMAFSALRRALAVVFQVEKAQWNSSKWVTVLIPYGFVLFVGISVFAITVLLAAVELSESSWVAAWLPPSGVLSVLAGFAGEVALFGLIYYVLTPVTVPARHALVGAIAAALMWELMRQVLVWYFANLSSVNMIYGTFATVLVIVLSLQVAAGILLLGAQVIREYGKLPDDC